MNVSDKAPTALSVFQQHVLRALVDGAVLYAQPDGTLSYLSRTGQVAAHNTDFRCLRIVPASDFRALQAGYVQPVSSAVGTAVKVYEATALGRQAAGGLTHEA